MTLGMWMPKQKDGLNWAVDFSVTKADGATQEGTKKFRVQADAANFCKKVRDLINTRSYEGSKINKLTTYKIKS